MFIRMPTHQPLANSNTALALLVRSRNGAKVIEIGGKTFIATIVMAAILLAWYLFATLYLVFRDDVVVSLVTSDRKQSFHYEDRIAELRSRIDRMTARQLITQETIEDRVANLIARQAELEARAVMVAELGEKARNTGIATRSEAPTGYGLSAYEASSTSQPMSFAPTPPARPRPIPMESAPLELPQRKEGESSQDIKMRGAFKPIVDEIERRTDRMETGQLELMRSLSAEASLIADRAVSVINATGLPTKRFGDALAARSAQPVRVIKPLDDMKLRDVNPSVPASAVGGPLIPVSALQRSERFETDFAAANQILIQAEHARAVLRSLPLARPLPLNHEQTSHFGVRVDPFTRGYAQHSGLDFRAPTGTPVRATAGGTVIEAGTSGGYGRMVEIDHGNGISSRYAHLSMINVREGDRIAKGVVIGAVGSTGRSTGPHLHYEIRIDDDATDPQRFLRAGRLAASH